MKGAIIVDRGGAPLVFERRVNPAEGSGFCSLCQRDALEVVERPGVLVHREGAAKPYHWLCKDCCEAIGRAVQS